MRFNKVQVSKKVEDAVQTATKEATETATHTTRKAADAEHYGRAARSFRRGIAIGIIIGIGTSIAITTNYYESIKDVIIKINNVLLEARQQQN